MKQSRQDNAIDELLNQAEPRLNLSVDDTEALYASLRPTWLSVVRRHRTGYWMLGIAATLMVSVLLNFMVTQTDAPPAPQASLVAAAEASFVGSEKRARPISASRYFAGQHVNTDANTRLALALSDGSKLRLKENTRILLVGQQHIKLLSGTIYYDSYDHAVDHNRLASASGNLKKNTITIDTGFGTLQNLGTQFMVNRNTSSLVITVRSGQVNLHADNLSAQVDQGTQLVVDEEHEPTWDDAVPYGDEWYWVESTLPEFELDDSPVMSLLDWVSRETGRQIVFGSEEAKLLAQSSRLVGKVDRSPLDALSIWMETVDLQADVKQDTIIIAVHE